MEPGSSGPIILLAQAGNNIYIVLLIILVMISAFFSAAETALTSISQIRLRNLIEEKVVKAEKVDLLLKDPNKLLSAILIGNNIANILASSIATVLFASLIVNQDLAVAAASAVMTIIILIFAEITPKIYASQNAEKISFLIVDLVAIVVKLLSPIVFIINKIVGVFIRLLGGDASQNTPFITAAELKTLLSVSHKEGVLKLDESVMINNVFDFGDSQAKDVMVPRPDMIAIPKDIEFKELMYIYEEERFSRIPVYNETIDDVIGILHLKDLIFFTDIDNFNVLNFTREPYFTYEFKDTDELFAIMRSEKIQIAIVLDEYGSTEGLVTIEDLVEEIVGEIEDEYDKEEIEIELVKEDEFIVDGATRIEDVNEIIGVKLSSEDFDTIGGYIIGLLGRFPDPYEVVEDKDLKFIIEEIDKNRIESVRIHI